MHLCDAHSTLIKAQCCQQIIIPKYWEISHLQMRQKLDRDLTQNSRQGPLPAAETQTQRAAPAVNSDGRLQATVTAECYSGYASF